MPESNNECLAPPVYWAQRKNSLYILIHVPDCVNPIIKVEKDKLYFRGKGGIDSKEYELSMEFLNEINVEESKYAVKGRGPEFVLKKAVDGPYWQRLLKDAKKRHWLKIDFNQWKDEDDSDEGGDQELDFEKIMQNMAGLKSSDTSLNDLEVSDSDEDEGLENVEPCGNSQ